MKLYHISFDGEDTKTFKPRIPAEKNETEDSVTPRICFSETIAGALSALPALCDRMEAGKWDMMIYELDTNKVNNEDLVDCRELYLSGRVFDAVATKEWWYKKEITLTGRKAKLYDSCFEATNYLVTSESNRERVYEVIEEVVKRNNNGKNLVNREDCDKYTMAYMCNEYAWQFDSDECYAHEEIEDKLLEFCQNLRIIYNMSYMYYDDMIKLREYAMPMDDKKFIFR